MWQIFLVKHLQIKTIVEEIIEKWSNVVFNVHYNRVNSYQSKSAANRNVALQIHTSADWLVSVCLGDFVNIPENIPPLSYK